MAGVDAVFASSNFPGPREAARGSYNLSQLKSVRDLGVSLEVVAARPWFPLVRSRYSAERGPDGSLVEGLRVSYPRVLYLPLSRGAANGRLYALSIRWRLRRLAASAHPRLLWSSFVFPDGVGGGLVAQELGLPHVVSVVGSDWNLNVDRPRRVEAIVSCLRSAAVVLAKSRALRDSLVASGVPGDRVLLDYNGVDQEVFSPQPRDRACARLGLPPAPRRILFVGGLVPVKNVPVLLAAFDRLRKGERPTGVELVLIGDGYLRDKLREEALQRGLGEQVRFLGALSHHEVATWLAACDVLCLPSRAEGVPNVVLEALASGRPVVASNVGGIPEVHPGEAAGELVPPNDEDALAQALGRTLSRRDDPQRLRALVAGFTWSANARSIVDRLALLGLVSFVAPS